MRKAGRFWRRILDSVEPALKLQLMRIILYNRSTPGVLVWSALQQWSLYRWDNGAHHNAPPAAVKHRVIRAYADRFKTHVLVETGTFLGDTVFALRNDFDRIISIELDPRLAAAATSRFADNKHIRVIHGDSGHAVRAVLGTLQEPALFWLDAHWSGGVTARAQSETPLVQELELIAQHSVVDHVVLIDDAQLLGNGTDYPSRDAVRGLVARHRPQWAHEEVDGIARLHS